MGLVDFSSYTYDDDEEKKKRPSQEAKEQLDFQRREGPGLVDFSDYTYKEPKKEPTKTFQVEQPEEEEEKGLFKKGVELFKTGAKKARDVIFGKPEEEQTIEEQTGMPKDRYSRFVGVAEQKKREAEERLRKIQSGEYELAPEVKKEAEEMVDIGTGKMVKRKEARPGEYDLESRRQQEILALKDTIEAYQNFIDRESARRGVVQQLWSNIKQPADEILKVNLFERTQIKKDEKNAFQKYKRLNRNEEELTEEEQTYLNRFRARNFNQYIKKGVGAKAADTATDMPHYMAEMLVMGQMAGGKQKYTQMADDGLKLIGVSNQTAKKFAEKFLSNSVRKAVASQLDLPSIDAKTAEYMLPTARLNLEGKGVLEVMKEGEDKDAAVSKAYASNLVEYVSEGVGDYVDGAGRLAKKAFVNKWLKNKGLQEASEGVIRKALNKVPLNSVVGEVFEEEFAEPVQSIIDEREYNDPFFTPEGRERLLVETLGITLFGGMAQVSDVTSNKLSQRRKQNPKDKIMVRTAEDAKKEGEKDVPEPPVEKGFRPEDVPTISKEDFLNTIGVEQEDEGTRLWVDYQDYAKTALENNDVESEPEAFEKWMSEKFEKGDIVPGNLPDVIKKEFEETEKFERQEEITREDILEEYPNFNEALGFEGDVAENLKEEFIQFTKDNKNIPLDEAFETWQMQSEALAKAEAKAEVEEYEGTETELLDRIKGEVASSNLEQAQKLYNQGDFEQTFEEIKEETKRELKQVYGDVGEETGQVLRGLPEDHPDKKVVEIADRIGKHFKAPGALYKVVGAKRTYRTADGTELLIKGDTYSFFDRWVFANDIEGFKNGLKVLAYKFNKTFSELWEMVEKGDIDNADFNKFEKRLEKHLKERPAYAKRSREVAKERTTREEREGEEPSDEAAERVPSEQRAEEGREEPEEVGGLEGYTRADIRDIARNKINDWVADTTTEGEFEVVDLAVTGSRVRGEFTDESDVDVVVEYEGTMREDGAFNGLNADKLEIGGVELDINPIKAEDTGTIEEFLGREEGEVGVEAEEPGLEQTKIEGAKPSAEEMQRMYKREARKKRAGTRKGFKGTPFGEEEERETLREQMGGGLFGETDQVKEGSSEYYNNIRESLANGDIPEAANLREALQKSPARVKFKEIGSLKFPGGSIASPADIAWVFRDLRNEAVESFYVVGLKGDFPVAVELISIGSLNASIASPFEVTQMLQTRDIDGAYIVHNHPSGDPTPSTDDIGVTKRIAGGLNNIGVELKGHVIVNSDQYGFVNPTIKHYAVNERAISATSETQQFPKFKKSEVELPIYQKQLDWIHGEANKPKEPQLKNSKQVAMFTQKFQENWDKNSMIIYMNTRNVVQGIDVVPKENLDIESIVKSAGNMRGNHILLTNHDMNIAQYRDLQKNLHKFHGIDLVDSVNVGKDGAYESYTADKVAEGEEEYRVEKVGLRADLGDKGGYKTVEDFEKEIGLVQAVEFPELYQLAKRLGADAELNSRLRSSLGRAVLGKGFEASAQIELRPDVFEDPMIARKTLAHEIGHLTDYLPEGTLGRGRLVGRIASLKNHLKHEYKDLKDPELRKELKNITQIWKPFNEAADPNYTKYRYSSKELYADAISVLFNKPELLKQKAPKFWDSFFEYMDRKPEVKREYFATWTTLNRGADAVGSARQKKIREMFKKGEDIDRANREEQRIRKENMAFELKYQLIDKNQKVIDKVKELRAEGKNVGADVNPEYWLEGNNYVGGKVKDFLQVKIQPIKNRVESAGLSWEDLGEALFLERIAKERGAVANPADTLRHELGDARWNEVLENLPDDIRGESAKEQMKIMKRELSDVPHPEEENMFEYVSKQLPESIANPLGYNRKTAEDQLEWFKNQLGDRKVKILERELENYREVMDEVLDEAIGAELYRPDLIKKIKANPAYATFQVLDYMDSYIPSTIKHQVGTLKGVANPATSTVLKTISTIRAIEKNKTSQVLVNFMRENFSEEIEPAKTRWTGKTHIPVKPKEQGKGLLTVIEEGKYKGYVVDEYIAKTMEYADIGQAKGIIRGLKFMGRYWFRPVFTTFNLGFQTFNLVRDFSRFWKNTPGMSFARGIKRYAQAVKPAWKRAWDIKDKTISEMRQKKLLGLTYYDLIKGQTDTDTQIEAQLRKYGVKETKQKKGFFAPARKLLDTIGRFGDFIESIPKVAGYKELNGKLPNQKLGHTIRTQVGSPDFLRKGAGYGWYNEVFLFGNAIKEGIRSDIEVATSPRTRSSFWIKTVKANILPKVIMFGLLSGLFGDDWEEMMRGVSEYDKTNYIIVPLGMKNGKTVYMRIPQDETGRLMGGLFWKMLRMKDTEQNLARDLKDVFTYAGGQVPGLNPSLTFLLSTRQFLTGKNPYDYFRGRPAIPETEFKAGGKYALKPFLTWQFKQIGGGTLWRGYVSQQAPETKSWVQKVVEAPILSNIIGRWVKVSDYGKLEKAREGQKIIERESARESLEEEKIVEDHIKLFLDGEQADMRQKRIERKMLKEAIPGFPKIGDDSDKRRKANRIIKKYRQGILYKTTDDERIRRVIDLWRNEAKVKELLKMRGNTDLKDFQNLVEKLKFEKVISDKVIEELNKRSSAKPSDELVFRLVKPAHAAESPHNAEENTYDLEMDKRKKGGIAHLIKEKLGGFFKSLNVLKSKDEIVSPIVEEKIGNERIEEPEPEEFEKSVLPSKNKPESKKVIEYKEKLDMPDEYAKSVEKWSEKYDVGPKFVMGSMRQESGGAGYKTDLKGSSGEIGLMQVLPDIWKQFDKDKLDDYDYNIMAGVRILKRRLWEASQIGFEGDYGLALAMYNAGYRPENGLSYARTVFDHIGIDYSESRWLSEEEGRGFTKKEEETLGIRKEE